MSAMLNSITSTGNHLVDFFTNLARHDLPPNSSFPARISRSSIDTLVCHSSTCAICLNPLKSYPSVKLTCTHAFHVFCIHNIEEHDVTHNNTKEKAEEEPKYNDKSACPLCRRDYPYDSAESFFIEGCRMFFLLRSQIKYKGDSEKKSNEHILWKKNQDEMIRLWRSAAHLGYKQAQVNLAHVYNHGNCVDRNYEKAAFWYQLLSDQGDARSQFRLARLYSNGQGVKQNDKKAFDLYQQSAEQGYPNSQLCYGVMLLHGKACEQNKEEAIDWLRKASDQNNQEAELILSNILVHDDNNKLHNYKEAFIRYQDEANQGNNSEAMYELGQLYLNGKGCDKNEKEAYKYFKESSLLNNINAKHSLGLLYLNGIGCTRSLEHAVSLFKESASKDHPESQCILASLLLNNPDLIVDDINEEEDDDDNKTAHYFSRVGSRNRSRISYTASSSSPSPTSHNNRSASASSSASSSSNEVDEDGLTKHEHDLIAVALGQMKQKLEDEEPELYPHPENEYKQSSNNDNQIHKNEIKKQHQNNIDLAESLYRSAAEKGNAEAQYEYAEFISNVKKNGSIRKAIKWYLQAAQQDHIGAAMYLGNLYYFGDGIKGKDQDYHYLQAGRWYKVAADLHHVKAQRYLGYMLYHGLGVQGVSMKEEAAEWYYKAAKQGDHKSQFYLGLMKIKGLGVKTNYNEGYDWLLASAKQNNDDAQYNLAKLLSSHSQGMLIGRSRGLNIKKDAIKWCKKAVKNGHDKATLLLPKLTCDGE